MVAFRDFQLLCSTRFKFYPLLGHCNFGGHLLESSESCSKSTPLEYIFWIAGLEIFNVWFEYSDIFKGISFLSVAMAMLNKLKHFTTKLLDHISWCVVCLHFTLIKCLFTISGSPIFIKCLIFMTGWDFSKISMCRVWGFNVQSNNRTEPIIDSSAGFKVLFILQTIT